MPGLFALSPFRVRSYRYQWAADLLISWAFEMEALILGWYVLVETGSVLLLTVYGALQYGGTLIAPMLGVASDRIGHRKLLAGMRAIYALVAATLMMLAFAGALTPFVVFVLAAVVGFVRPSDMGMRGALVAETMPLDQLTGAMGISRTTSDTARIAGALAGAGLAASLGVGPAYVAITIFYVLGAILTWRAVAAPSQSNAQPAAVAVVAASSSPWRDLKEGVVHIWNTPSLLAIVWLALLFNLTIFPITNGLLPYVAKEVYLVDQTGLGYLVASLSFGAFLGAIAMTWFGIGVQLPRLMMVAGVVWHILMLIFAHMESLGGGVVMLMVVGVAQSLAMVCHTVILLRVTSRRFRGRVTGVRMMAIYTLPLGLLGAGVLIGWIGFRATTSLYAIVGLAFVVLIAVRYRAYMWRRQVPESG